MPRLRRNPVLAAAALRTGSRSNLDDRGRVAAPALRALAEEMAASALIFSDWRIFGADLVGTLELGSSADFAEALELFFGVDFVAAVLAPDLVARLVLALVELAFDFLGAAFVALGADFAVVFFAADFAGGFFAGGFFAGVFFVAAFLAVFGARVFVAEVFFAAGPDFLESEAFFFADAAFAGAEDFFVAGFFEAVFGSVF